MKRHTHAELEELLAPYAIDAVDDAEAETVELHLRECPRCRAAVTSYRDTASHLAAGHGPAPVQIWDAIVARLDGADRPEDALPALIPLHQRRRRTVGLPAMAAVAAAVLIITGLVVQVVAQGGRVERMQTALEQRNLLSAALAAEAHPDARRAELRTAGGEVVANAVMTPDGTGFLRSAGLRGVQGHKTYQLWAVIGSERISAGVLGQRPHVAPFTVAGDVVALAITEEAAGGAVTPQNQPVATGVLVEA